MSNRAGTEDGGAAVNLVAGSSDGDGVALLGRDSGNEGHFHAAGAAPASPNTGGAPSDMHYRQLRRARLIRVLLVTWVGYAAYTAARRPFSLARSAIEVETGLSKYASSFVDTAFLACYTLGQLLYPSYIRPLAPARTLLGLGLLGSAACCLLIGMSWRSQPGEATSGLLILFLVAWGANGLLQAAGWASCLTVLTPWLVPAERGTIMGAWGTNMAAGGIIGNVLTSALIEASAGGWRYAFSVNAVLLGLVALLMIIWLLPHPNRRGLLTAAQAAAGYTSQDLADCTRFSHEGEALLPPPENTSSGSAAPNSEEGRDKTPSGPQHLAKKEKLSLSETLSLPGVGALSLSYFFHKLVRYSLMFWLPYLLHRELGMSLLASGYVAALLDVGGVLGTVLGGWGSDRYANGTRRAMALVILSGGMMASLGLFSLLRILPLFDGAIVTLFAVLLTFASGFFSFAIDSIMTSSLQQDLADRIGFPRHVGSIAAVVGAVGAAGSILQGPATAFLSDQSWFVLFFVLAALTLVATALMAPLLQLEERARRVAAN